MTNIAYDWKDKLLVLEGIIDQKVSENTKNYGVLDQMNALVQPLTSIQLHAMLGYVASCPQLALLPETLRSQYSTIYDIIELNMRNLLIAHGEQYFKDTYATTGSTR